MLSLHALSLLLAYALGYRPSPILYQTKSRQPDQFAMNSVSVEKLKKQDYWNNEKSVFCAFLYSCKRIRTKHNVIDIKSLVKEMAMDGHVDGHVSRASVPFPNN